MIQMLNDINKINIKLKVTQITLNAVQTCLQKEMKKKNMMIHYLEVTLS